MPYIYPATNMRYRVYYLYKTKKIYIGLYHTYEKALLAYQFIENIFTSSISLKDYTPDCPITFEKFVACINFRDNHMYFKTSIYVQSDHFKYYISPDLYLIFDLKDLLYFSNKRIHKRGDYLYTYIGDQQENILKRFGFNRSMTYLKDYDFLNNNRYDFRRKNIHIINHYYGVSLETKYNKTTYVTRIVLNKKNLVVGHYSSDMLAAIAYNKAVDLVTASSNEYHYSKNTFPFLTRQEYDSLYESLPISKRLTSHSIQNRVCSDKKWRGVAKDQSSYRALIGFQKKRIYLGNYPTEKRAAQAYNYASLYLHGPNGYINDVSPLVYSNDALKIAEKLQKAGVLKTPLSQSIYTQKNEKTI